MNSMMGSNKSVSMFLCFSRLLFFTIIVLWFTTGCGTETVTPIAAVKPPEISEPRVGASAPLKPGQQAGIAIDVTQASGETTLTYTWETDGGEIVRGQGNPAITYEAPDEPGIYNVTVEVKWDGQSAKRTTSISVEEEPTPTPTPILPTDTPTPETSTSTITSEAAESSTATAEPLPATSEPLTDTPIPAEPVPPPCSLISTRPPLGGPPVDVEIQITSPSHCATGLPTGGAVGGTYSGDLTNKEIWVLVYPTDLKFYPQTPDACKMLPADASNGVWNTRVGYGGPPQQYDVVVVVTETDGPASQEFKQWLQRGCEASDFPGYAASELPEGLTEVAAITVSTE